MALKNNPIFKLASDVTRGVLSREEAFSLAASPGFVKKLGKKDFEEVIVAPPADYTQPDPQSLPPELTALAIECAKKKGLRGELWGMLHVAHAQVSLQNGDLETAQHYSRLAKKVLRKNGSSLAMLLSEMAEAGAQLMSGNLESFSRLQKSLYRRRTGRGEFLLARSQLQLAQTLSFLGEYEHAIERFQRAKSLLARLKEQNAHFGILHRRHSKGADPELTKRRSMYNLSICICDMGIATSFAALGKYDAAVTRLVSGRKRAQPLGAPAIVAQFEVLYALVCRTWGDWDNAIGILEQSRELRRAMRPVTAFQADILLAHLYCDTERYELAISLLEDMMLAAGSEGALDRVADSERVLAKAYRRLGRIDMATDLLQGAKEVFQDKEMDLDVAWCDVDLAWLQAESGKYGEALRTFRRLEGKFTGMFSMGLSYQCHHGAGYVLWKTGRYEEGRKEYEAAISFIERFRTGSSLEDLRASLLDAAGRVYSEVVELCLDQGDYSGAFECVERLKSRNLAEMLEGRTLLPKNIPETEMEEYRKLSFRVRATAQKLNKERNLLMPEERLEDFFLARQACEDLVRRIREKDPWFDPEHTLPCSASHAQSLVSNSSTALIEIFPMRDKTVVFLILHEKRIEDTTVIIGGYTEASLDHDLKAIQRKDQLEDTLRRLYEQLFIPIKPLLTGVTKITFVPYSGLHLIPLHAMFTEENGSRKYLIDDFLVTYAPSVKVMSQCLGMERVGRDRGFVASSDPSENLSYSPHEAKAVARHFSTEVNRRTTRQEFISRGRAAQVVHYTGHADGNALILQADKTSQEPDLYDVGDIFASLDFPESWLVTLSACDTGKVRIGKTDEYIGLPSAFLHAGAATVICSLWPVSDLSTTLLMGKMYELMDKGLGKAESLWKAQLWLKDPRNREEHLAAIHKLGPWATNHNGRLADADRFERTFMPVETILPEDLDKPYYWAGFICTGAP